MSGAVVLASTAAIYQGSGKVWAGFNQTALPFAVIPERPEIMLATAEDLLKRSDISAWAVGCGMGLDETANSILNTVLTQNQDAPLLLRCRRTDPCWQGRIPKPAKPHKSAAIWF